MPFFKIFVRFDLMVEDFRSSSFFLNVVCGHYSFKNVSIISILFMVEILWAKYISVRSCDFWAQK